MTSIKIECARCQSTTYRLLDPKTGEVMCEFCRTQWIVPELIQKTETEKFLEEQAKQPRIIVDNTTETDEQLMEIVTSLVSPVRAIRSIVGNVIRGALFIFIIVFVIMVGFVIVTSSGFFR